MQPSHRIGYLLQHVSALLARHSDQVLQEQLGIGFSQFKILRMLETQPEVKQRDIAANLGQTEASISRQVKLMLEAGLLHVIVSPKDHRQHLTVPTRKGERLTYAAMEALARYHAPTFDALSDKRQGQLTELLEVLHAQLCQVQHPDPSHHK